MDVYRIRALLLAVFVFAPAPLALAAPFGAATTPPGARDIEPAGYIYRGGRYSASAPAGRPTLVLRVNDGCDHHAAPSFGAAADHGAVTTKEGTAALCGNPNEPVREVWYTSAHGFHGVDTVTLVPFGIIIDVTVR
jgi:hypothetical protein